MMSPCLAVSASACKQTFMGMGALQIALHLPCSIALLCKNLPPRILMHNPSKPGSGCKKGERASQVQERCSLGVAVADDFQDGPCIDGRILLRQVSALQYQIK